MMQKFVITISIIIQLVIYFLLLPYAQKLANSHIYSGIIFGIVFYLVAAWLLLVGLMDGIKEKKYLMIIYVIVIAFMFIWWGKVFTSLECHGCLNSG
jgi:hypothetical protein